MKEIFLTENQMQQALDQLEYYYDQGSFKGTLELDTEFESDNVVEIDVEGCSSFEWEMEQDMGGYNLVDSYVTLELTGVRNYNPDLDIFEDAWINDAQYNELINDFQTL